MGTIVETRRPAIHARRAGDAAQAATKATVKFFDAALLFEHGLDALCDETICVTCPVDERRRRVLARGTTSATFFDAIERGVLVRFVTDRPMSTSDLRVPEAVNAALSAALEGDDAARGMRVEVRVDVEV